MNDEQRFSPRDLGELAGRLVRDGDDEKIGELLDVIDEAVAEVAEATEERKERESDTLAED